MKKYIYSLSIIVFLIIGGIGVISTHARFGSTISIPQIKKGEVLTIMIPVWAGAETTTTSTSYVTKTFLPLDINSNIYNLSGYTKSIEFAVIGSSCTIELYNHTAGASVAGSEMIIDATYSTTPSIANYKSVVIPASSFSSTSNIYSMRMKATAGVTAKVADAIIIIKYTKL